MAPEDTAVAGGLKNYIEGELYEGDKNNYSRAKSKEKSHQNPYLYWKDMWIRNKLS